MKLLLSTETRIYIIEDPLEPERRSQGRGRGAKSHCSCVSTRFYSVSTGGGGSHPLIKACRLSPGTSALAESAKLTPGQLPEQVIARFDQGV